jgi:hypothetical protein
VNAPNEALRLADRGLRVFPLSGKKPTLDQWQIRATTDPDALDLLPWAPGSNIAIATGVGSDVFAVDVDFKSGGFESLAALIEVHGPLPLTWTVKTGGKGEHLYFRHPGGVVRNSQSKVGTGIDIRGDGGCVVAPPSIHPETGDAYAWAVSPDDVDLADAPAWLLAALTAEPARHLPPVDRETRSDAETVRRATGYLAKMPASVSGQGGHNAAFKAACKLVQGFALAPELVRTLLDEFSKRCMPPWSSRELDHKVAEAIKEPLPAGKEWGYLVSAPAVDDRLQRRAATNKGPGAPHASFANFCLLFDEHPRWAGRFAYDEFRGRVLLDGRHFDEDSCSNAQIWLEREYFPTVKKPVVWAAVHHAAIGAVHNEIADYLRGLRWDGVRRLNSWLSRVTGQIDDPLRAAFGRCFLIQAVARGLEPGCKADCALVLVGPQGIGKSTLLRDLASPAWFADAPLDLQSKDSVLQIEGTWVFEVAEWAGFRTQRADRLKAFLSRANDRIRRPWATSAENIPRRCVFAGTTNDGDFLSDPSGSRRFWPVACSSIDLDWLHANRDQLWAEAVAAYDAGVPWHLDRSTEDLRAAAAGHFEQADPWEAPLADYLDQHDGQEHRMNDLLERVLERPRAQGRGSDARRVGGLLRKLGWERYQKRLREAGGKPVKLWRKASGGSV